VGLWHTRSITKLFASMKDMDSKFHPLANERCFFRSSLRALCSRIDRTNLRHFDRTLVEAADLSDRNQLPLVATRQSDAAAENELSFDTKKDIADCYLRLTELPTFASPKPLRAFALAAEPPDCVYAGVVAAPQATATPLRFSVLVPAARARRFIRRVQVTTPASPIASSSTRLLATLLRK
jgi:hypothetical protein